MAEKDNKTENPKPIDYDSLIGDLIKKIDNEKSLFRVRDYFRVLSLFIFITLIISFGVLSTYFGSSISSSDRFVIVFAGAAVIVSLAQFEIASAEDEYTNLNYYKAVKSFNTSKEEKPLLRALIKMKSENSNFTLAEIYKICPEMFSKEKLLKKLYE
jgi:hypothetical protein